MTTTHALSSTLLYPILIFVALSAAVSCGDDDLPELSNTPSTTASTPTETTTSTTTTTTTTTPPTRPAEPEPWCASVSPGPAQTDIHPHLGLSQAHARVRFFGTAKTYSEVDATLAQILQEENALDDPNTLFHYAASLKDTCALDASPPLSEPLEDASFTTNDSVAILTPGPNPQPLPDSVSLVILDLRDLTHHPDAQQALYNTLSTALHEPLTLPTTHTLQHIGLIDEYFSVINGSQNVFRVVNHTIPGETIPATATQQRALLLYADGPLPAYAAEVAIALRLQGRAWVAGSTLYTSTAESSWVPAGSTGIAWRTRELSYGDDRLPDTIPADFEPTADLNTLAVTLPSTTPDVIPASSWQATRPTLQLPDPNSDLDTHESNIQRGQTRTALLTAHGAARLFFPFFSLVGDELDPRLLELLPLTTPSISSRAQSHNLLRRLSNALEDAHSFVADLAPDDTSNNRDVVGFLPAALDSIQGRVFVRRSSTDGLQPGDELLSINNTPVPELIAAELPLISAATPQNANLQALTPLSYLTGPTPITLRTPNGDERTITAQPVPLETFRTISGSAFKRPSGWLDDLNASNVLYINLDRNTSDTDASIRATFPNIPSARALILDMRGYPGTWTALYELAGIVVGEPYSSPRFTFPVWTGPDNFEPLENHTTYNGPPNNTQPFQNPVILITGPGTQSAAENFSMGLVSERAVTTLGRQSSGTNGNITGLILPGNFAFTFTGLGVTTSTRRRFHGVGIQPTIEIYPTPTQLADDPDPELSAALDALQNL